MLLAPDDASSPAKPKRYDEFRGNDPGYIERISRAQDEYYERKRAADALGIEIESYSEFYERKYGSLD